MSQKKNLKWILKVMRKNFQEYKKNNKKKMKNEKEQRVLSRNF